MTTHSETFWNTIIYFLEKNKMQPLVLDTPICNLLREEEKTTLSDLTPKYIIQDVGAHCHEIIMGGWSEASPREV